MQTGKFPASYKRAQVLPLLKKNGLDILLLGNYRPISNLSTVSKVLERLVLTRLRPHLLESVNFTEYQSAYRKGHSIETALPEVLDSVHGCRQQAGHCSDRPRPVGGFRHSQPRNPAPAAAD